MSTPLLQVDELHVELPTGRGWRTAIHDVTLDVRAGEAVGLVGESGSGKSMTARSIMRLLPPGARTAGDIRFDSMSITGLTQAELRRLRATEIAMIFQDPTAHINPVRTIGDFLVEGLVTTLRVKRREARRQVAELLREVGVDDPERRLRQRPWELSGGLLQRVMIASTLAIQPRLLLADEPTTALDVTTQAEVVAILDEQRSERGLAMLFITHDLELAAAVCDRIAVMYAGVIVEELPAVDLRRGAVHPYTRALLAARPDFDTRHERLPAIPGRPLSASEAPPGCPFATRCPHVQQVCWDERPSLRPVGRSNAACHLAEATHADHTSMESADAGSRA